MTLDTIWAAIPERRWEFAEALNKTLGVDEQTFRRVVNFLVRWDFIEIEQSPELRIRKKAGALSPIEVVNLLSLVNSAKPRSKRNRRTRLAERVACRACGSLNLTHLAENEVECAKCHERQWFTIEKPQKDSESVRNSFEASPTCLSGHKEDIPTPKQFDWFKKFLLVLHELRSPSTLKLKLKGYPVQLLQP